MSNRKLRQATQKGGLPSTALLAYASPQKQEGEHNLVETQFEETR
jgi:hypothetical protein